MLGSPFVSPTKVELRKSFLFTESFLVLKIKNTLEGTEHFMFFVG